MKLLHYSAVPFEFDPNRHYDYDQGCFKPRGLWVSVEGEYDWPAWCRDSQFKAHALEHVAEIVLTKSANILLIDTAEKLIKFDGEFRVPDEYFGNIAWGKVSHIYDGIIIAPYQWEHRLGMHWYYGWDCASGVIWNLSVIEIVRQCETVNA